MSIPSVIRRNTFLLATFQCMIWISQQLTATLGSIIIFKLTDSKSLVGLASTLTFGSGAVTVLCGGRLMDRYGRRPALVLASGLGITGATIILFSVEAGYLPGFLVGLVLFGGGTAMGQLARFAAADMYPTEKRGLGISFVVVGGTVGAIAGPLLVGPLSDFGQGIGWNPLATPWAMVPAALALGAVAIILIRPDPKDIASNLSRYYPGAQLATVREESRALADLLRLRPNQASIVAIALLQANMMLVMVVVPLVLATRGWSMSVISMLMAVHFVGMLCLSVVAGKLSDSLGRRNVIIAGCVISAVGCIIAPLSENLIVIALSYFMIGLGWSFVYVAGTSAMSDVTQPLERGKLLGFNDLVLNLCGSGMAMFAGILLALAGFEMVAFAGFLLGVIPIALAIRLREPRPGVFLEPATTVEIPATE